MKGDDVLVSVIIPTYNRASLLDRCLVSVHQSGVENLEVIVVDDGGTDHTSSIVEGRGIYLRQDNAGPAAARNLGFDASHGPFVAFIDSDDEWVNGGVARLVPQFLKNPELDVLFADSLMGNYAAGFTSFLEAYGSNAFFELPHSTSSDRIRVLDRGPFFHLLSTRNVMFLGSMLIRREFFIKIGRFDPELRGAAEDWYLFMRMAAEGIVGYSEGPAVSRYYKHGEGLSDNEEDMQVGFIRALEGVRRLAPLDSAERRHVSARLRAHVFGWAWNAYQRGDLETTRQRLRYARALGEFGPREAAYLAATYLPSGLAGLLRRIRRAI